MKLNISEDPVGLGNTAGKQAADFIREAIAATSMSSNRNQKSGVNNLNMICHKTQRFAFFKLLPFDHLKEGQQCDDNLDVKFTFL